MMGVQAAAARFFYDFCLDDHVPDDHQLRGIDRHLDLEAVRNGLKPFYSNTGRPSVDPEPMIRMLVVGYCMGIRSERRLCEEVHLNLAYRWFCRLGLDGKVPDHALTETALPLVVLPASCSLQSYTLAQLDKYEVPYYIAHSASGVGGLNSALAAGLGVGCLNISAMSSGVGISAAAAQLPVLPEIEFALVAPRDGDPSRISVIERAFLESANPT